MKLRVKSDGRIGIVFDEFMGTVTLKFEDGSMDDFFFLDLEPTKEDE